MKIDTHSHIEIPEVLELLPVPLKNQFSHLSSTSAAYQERLEMTLQNQLCCPQRKLEDMGRMGLDMTILCIAPQHFYYTLDGDLALSLSRSQNDRISATVEKYPEKFGGMATVPLQNIEASVSELERAILELNLRGVEIASNVAGRYVGERSFWPLFEKAQALDVPIFIHPRNVAGADRMKDFYLSNLVGNPLDTTLAAAHLIFSGIFDHLPKLKIILAHAGGQLPYICGRLSHGFKVRPECQQAIKKTPIEYMKQFYFDTISHDPDCLRFLISRVGADHVLLGTDYPYDMSDMDPLGSLDRVPGLTLEEKEKISERNAVSLFKIL